MAAQLNGESQPVSNVSSNLNNGHLSTNGRLESQSIHKNASPSNIDQTLHPSTAPFSQSEQKASDSQNSNGLADFFSQEVFRIVLHNPTTAHRLLKFSQARMCGENMEFLEKVRFSFSTVA